MTYGDAAVAWARTQIGKPYRFGATGPDAYDCSGLTQRAYATLGIKIPRTTYEQVRSGIDVPKSDLQVGDLVFPDPGHVQLYSGNGNIIEAPTAGEKVRETAMWGFWRAVRVPFVVTMTPELSPDQQKALHQGPTISGGIQRARDALGNLGGSIITGLETPVGIITGIFGALGQFFFYLMHPKFLMLLVGGAILIGVGVMLITE